jgi:hypothetical protein
VVVKRKDLGDVTMGGTQPENSDSDEVRLASWTGLCAVGVEGRTIQSRH